MTTTLICKPFSTIEEVLCPKCGTSISLYILSICRCAACAEKLPAGVRFLSSNVNVRLNHYLFANKLGSE